MDDVTVFPDAVSVQYAREQYALGYLHGRAGAVPDGQRFVRQYVDDCAHAGALVDVEQSFAAWSSGTPTAQLALFS